MNKIDEVDKKIIDYMHNKGYQTGSMIANALGLPERVVYRRIKQLKETGAIVVTIRTNALVLGFRFWIRVAISSTPGCSRDVIKKLVEHRSVHTVNEVTGKYNILIGARFKTADQLISFVSDELPGLPGIENAETLLVIKPRKYLHFRWEHNENHDYKTESLDAAVSKTTFELDKIDRSILDIITVEGQTSAQKLSKRLGINATVIQRHLKTMSDNQVYDVDIKINPELTNYEFLATLCITVKGISAQSVLDEIMLDETYIINATLCIGRFNIILYCSFSEYDMINEYINTNLYSIHGINYIETYIFTKRHKYYVSQY